MLSFFRRLRRPKPDQLPEQTLIAAPLWAEAVAALPILDGLDPGKAERLRRLATLFLRDKIFEAAGGLVLDDTIRVRIAALACLPILGLNYDWYDGWRTVVVYPGEFVRPRSAFDDIGIMHEWEEVLTGESWERGPVILSWADVKASGQRDGYNVVIHEMAHKLDMLNGLPDGFPPLPKDLDRRAWTERFTAAFDHLNERLDRDESTAIDPYAAEEPGEFFAVLSEYFFELPHLVRTEYPAVYGLLAAFYRQDPAGRLPCHPSLG
jgi:Mlc titration factor MtfA (ptsG expression regulator)